VFGGKLTGILHAHAAHTRILYSVDYFVWHLNCRSIIYVIFKLFDLFVT